MLAKDNIKCLCRYNENYLKGTTFKIDHYLFPL